MEEADTTSIDSSDLQQAWDFARDSVLEPNDPASLDLARHQLFLDTTRTSEFYERKQHWKPTKYDSASVRTAISHLFTTRSYIDLGILKMPTNWVTVQRWNGEYVLYDRCDGIDPRVWITDSVAMFFGTHESDAEPILRIVESTEVRLQLELKTYVAKSPDERALITFERVDDRGIYRFEYRSAVSSWGNYMIPVERISAFDMVVNHCVKMKMSEFGGFDRD